MTETTMKEVGAGVEEVLPGVDEVGQLEVEVAAPSVDRGVGEEVDKGASATGGTLTLAWSSDGSQVLCQARHLGALESLLIRLKLGILWASQQVLEVLQLVERQALFSNLVHSGKLLASMWK